MFGDFTILCMKGLSTYFLNETTESSNFVECLLSTKRLYILKQTKSPAAGLFNKYAWPISGHRALKSYWCQFGLKEIKSKCTEKLKMVHLNMISDTKEHDSFPTAKFFFMGFVHPIGLAETRKVLIRWN